MLALRKRRTHVASFDWEACRSGECTGNFPELHAAEQVFRREVYARLFVLALAAQDFFKQSATQLHYIADKLVIKEPARMVEQISALGLRYVGFGIPADLFGPLVAACLTSESREAVGEAILA